jgi:hypothetical protein
MSLRWSFVLTLGFGCALLSAGCGKSPPAVVPTEGNVSLDGKPLANVTVTFMPLLDGFGAEWSSTGTTDEQGHFTLTCQINNQPGAAVGQHAVMITDAPVPEHLRRVQDTRELDALRAKSGSRPIPPQYGTFAKSPLRVEVKEGQNPIEITLTR